MIAHYVFVKNGHQVASFSGIKPNGDSQSINKGTKAINSVSYTTLRSTVQMPVQISFWNSYLTKKPTKKPHSRSTSKTVPILFLQSQSVHATYLMLTASRP